MDDAELLKIRICDLGLSVNDFEQKPALERFKEELRAKKVPFMPRFYFGDEWFSPEGSVAISIPFYLAHPRLIQLERAQMLEVEGEDEAHFLKLLRHEAGHCFDHGFRLEKRAEWKKLFGSPEKDYDPDTYRPRPYSRAYVHHLDNWYAQAHPVEDFAETFAVWMTPGRPWREIYAAWPQALKKLNYVESAVRRLSGTQPLSDVMALPSQASRLRSTLGKYYERRRRENPDTYPEFHDPDLRTVFTDSSAVVSKTSSAAVTKASASNFLKKNRKPLVDSVSYWSGEKKFTVNLLVKRLIERCEKLKLFLGRTESQTLFEVTGFLTTLVVHYQFTGKFRRDV